MPNSLLEIMPASGIAAVSVSRNEQAGASGRTQISAGDFIAVVASLAALEGEAGVVALVFGDDDDMAAYATRLIADSADLSGRLASAAATPQDAAMLPQHEEVLDAIRAIPRAEFSGEFAEILAGVNADAAALFEAGAECLADQPLSTLARDFHPIAASSAREAERLLKRYGATSAAVGSDTKRGG